jgi:hypothetical protein
MGRKDTGQKTTQKVGRNWRFDLVSDGREPLLHSLSSRPKVSISSKNHSGSLMTIHVARKANDRPHCATARRPNRISKLPAAYPLPLRASCAFHYLVGIFFVIENENSA